MVTFDSTMEVEEEVEEEEEEEEQEQEEQEEEEEQQQQQQQQQQEEEEEEEKFSSHIEFDNEELGWFTKFAFISCRIYVIAIL